MTDTRYFHGVHAQFFDNGLPANHHRVRFLRQGTDIEMPLWTTPAATVAAVNPQDTDENGAIDVYVPPGAYTIELLDADAGDAVVNTWNRTVVGELVGGELDVTGADFGGIYDGSSHTLAALIAAGQFADFAEAQVVYPTALSDADEVDVVALEKAFAAIPTRVTGWPLAGAGGTWGVYRAGAIVIPADRSGYFNRAPAMPTDRNVRLYTPAPRGARLEMAGSDQYLNLSPHSSNAGLEIENLVLWKMGVKVQDNSNGHVHLRSLQIEEAPQDGINWPNSPTGASNALIVYCDVNYAGRNALRIEQGSMQNTRIEQLRANGSTNAAVYLDSEGIVLRDCEFQGVLAGNFTDPYIHINPVNNSCAYIQVAGTRFGSESVTIGGSTWEHPREAILVGGSTPSDTTVTALSVVDCFGGGSNSGANHAQYFLKFNGRPFGCSIRGGGTNNYREAVVGEHWCELGTLGEDAKAPGRSSWFDPAFHFNPGNYGTAKRFSHGGIGWIPQPAYSPAAGALMPGSRAQQLDTTDLAAWSQTSLSGGTPPAKTATGPGGVASTAYAVIGDGSGAGPQVWDDLAYTTVAGNPDLTLYGWLRKRQGGASATHFRVRLQRRDTVASKHVELLNNLLLYPLTDEWRLFVWHRPAPDPLGQAKPLRVGFFIGDGAATADGMEVGPVGLIEGIYTANEIAQRMLWGDLAAVTALTNNAGGSAPDSTIDAITDISTAGSADVGPVRDAVRELAEKINELRDEWETLRTAM